MIVTNPYDDGELEADACWACGRAFDPTSEVVVVDAASPKVVHAEPECANDLVGHVQREHAARTP